MSAISLARKRLQGGAYERLRGADVLVVLQVPGNAADALPCERSQKKRRDLRHHLCKLAVAMSLMMVLLSCSRILDVKPVGHINDKEFWDEFRNGYKNLNADAYRFFVFQNIINFQKAPGDIQQEGSQKWQEGNPSDPWPPDNPQETIPQSQTPASNEPENNLRFLREKIYTETIWDFLK